MENETENKFLVSHVIANQNHQKVMMDVAEFCKDLADYKCVYNTSAVMVGITKAPSMFDQPGANAAQLSIITSCLIMWMATKEEADKHFNKVKLTLG